MRGLAVLLLLTLVVMGALSGCVGIKGNVTGANVSGAVTIDTGHAPPVPVVQTIIQKCEPPPLLMQKKPSLAPLRVQPMAPAQVLKQALADDASYNNLLADDDALIDFVTSSCQ